MTTIVAWERIQGNLSELIVASDSRLSGGERWDACAKVFDIGRTDAVLAFAGDTSRALPLVFQAVATTRSYEGSALRTLDLPKFAGHLRRVLNLVLSRAVGVAAEQEPDCEFILAGWSWSLNRFLIYKFEFDRGADGFISYATKPPRSLKKLGYPSFAIAGDGGPILKGKLAEKIGRNLIPADTDYLPLEELYQQTVDDSFRLSSVGGPVQVIKIYRSIRIEHLAVEVDGELSISGRPRLPAENISLRRIVRSSTGQWSVEA